MLSRWEVNRQLSLKPTAVLLLQVDFDRQPFDSASPEYSPYILWGMQCTLPASPSPTTDSSLSLLLAKVTESLRALSLVLSGALPMSRALHALESLDALLSHLTTEAAANLKHEEMAVSQGQAAIGPGEAGSRAALLPGGNQRRPAFMFAAAGLGSAWLVSMTSFGALCNCHMVTLHVPKPLSKHVQ